MPDDNEERGYDLTRGVRLTDFGDAQMLRGHVGDEAVLLARLGDDIVAVSSTCTHYGGPLDQGIVVDETVRCPWHHACFALRTGEAVGAPAFDPVASWKVERDRDRIVVRDRLAAPAPPTGPSAEDPASRHGGETTQNVLIIGGGAAGFACAEMLRRHGYDGTVTILSADTNLPYDRPKLSKQFLAGNADESDLPLVPPAYFDQPGIGIRLRTRVVSIDIDGRRATASDGIVHRFDHLVIATGAEPVTLPIPGSDREHVYTLRTVEDSAAIIARADGARHAVVVGSGFIGLETAASLAQRGLEVHVITKDSQPLEKVLGGPLSRRVRAEHEQHGTTFHTETSLTSIDDAFVTLEDGTTIPADLVIVGIGVKPRTGLAEAAGLAVDDGVIVDECLRTAQPRVYAAGDIARWKDSRDNRQLRVEHWVLAQRHGQHIARNILSGDSPFRDAPFFWSSHFDIKIRYVGHAAEWDDMQIDGDVDELDCTIRYLKNGATLAVATVGRDKDALRWAAKLERPASGC